MSSRQEPTLQEIVEVLQSGESGCAVCALVQASVVRGLKSFFAEFVNDPASRLLLRSALGFCRIHTPLLSITGDALGVAILYADLTELAIERLSAVSTARFRTGPFHSRRPRVSPCPACTMEAEADGRYTGALAAGLGEDVIWGLLESSAGLCTVHLEQTTRSAGPEHSERLLAMEHEKLLALQAELNEVIRKNDYRFRGEEWGAEKDSWLRAPAKIAKPR